MSADAKEAGKSPPKPPSPGATSPGVAPAPAKRPAPPPAPPVGAAVKAKLPVPPKPAGGPPPLVAPPPAAGLGGLKPPLPLAAPKPAAPPPAAPRPSSIPPLAVPPAAAPVAAAPAPAPMPSEPPLQIPMPTAAEQLDARPPRTTMDFLFELDSPVPRSGELDLRSMPDVQQALADSDARESAVELPRDSFHPPAPDSIEPPPASESERPDALETSAMAAVPSAVPRITLKSMGPANTAQEQHELRKRRLVTRLVTCRDAFRVLGFLDIREGDRSEIARLMMALDPALDPSGKIEGVAKEPATTLASASKEQIDRVERLVSPIEDKLLAVDDLITDQALATRVDAGRITAKTLARYGRLLISRRIQAGPRRDRFEWIATALLTRKHPDGRRSLVSAERATRLLELLIGGLPFKPKEQELEEAVTFLSGALERLSAVRNQEEFFESELFIDVHGYKVSMREHLLSPDFVYLSVAFNAGLHNRVEEWVASAERVRKSNQLKLDGSPREQLARRLRDEEAAVGDIFGVKPRAVARAVSVPPAAAVPTVSAAEKRKAREQQEQKKRAQSGRMGRLLLIGLAVLLALALGIYAGYRSGVIKIDDWRTLSLPGIKL